MKALILVALIAVAGTANAASLAQIRGLVTDKKMVELVAAQGKAGLQLDEINDSTKIVPRCQCVDITVKFVKKDAQGVSVEKKKFVTTVEINGSGVVVKDFSEKQSKE